MANNIITNVAIKIMTGMGQKSLSRLEYSSKHAVEQNEQLLFDILKRNKDTEFGRLHNFASIDSLEAFRKELPLSSYEDYEPYIDRMVEGEENLLYSDKTLGFSLTSGSSGAPKKIPANKHSLDAYVSYTWTRALALTSNELKAEGKHFKPGRGFYTLPSNTSKTAKGLPCSNIAEIGATKYEIIYHYLLTIPNGGLVQIDESDFTYALYRYSLEDENMSFFFSVFFSQSIGQMNWLKQNWRMLVDDIETGTVSENANISERERERIRKYYRPNPARAQYLRAQFEQGFDETILKRIWPNIQFISSIGTAAYRPAAEHFLKYAQGIPCDYSIYGASEALIAACYKLGETDMQLLTDSCYYEFIPEDGDESDIKTISELEVGKHYEIVLTTQAGLYRYRIKDIVEVTGFRDTCPIINFLYRKGQLISASGEKFSLENGQTVIDTFEKENNITINNWILYLNYEDEIPHYTFLLECEEGVDLTGYVDEFEKIMETCNDRYGLIRILGDVTKLEIRMQKPGSHDAWREDRAKQGGYAPQIKPVHMIDNDTKKEFFLSRLI